MHPQIQERLSQVTGYYRPLSQNSTSKRELEAGHYKWGGKENVSDYLKKFIIHLSDKLNLDEKQTFDLADLYFSHNPQAFVKISQCESNIQNFSQSLSQNTGVPDFRHTQIQESNEELRKIVLSLVSPIRDLYYEERLSLLKTEVALATSATLQANPLQPSTSMCIDSLFRTKNYENSLWNLIYDFKNKILIKQNCDLEEREQHLIQMLKEEFTLLQVIFVLYFQLKDMKPQTYLKMLTYFNDTQFMVNECILKCRGVYQNFTANLQSFIGLLMQKKLTP